MKVVFVIRVILGIIQNLFEINLHSRYCEGVFYVL